jgi:precorrin-6A synthase
MMELFLVGCGTGNPDHLTMQGLSALRSAELILLPTKGAQKSALADIRYQILQTHLGASMPQIQNFEIPSRASDIPYQQAVLRWHDEIADRWQTALAKASSPQKVALMIWGDPSVYDSAMRIAERLRPVPEITVIPGISAIQVPYRRPSNPA